MRSFVNFESEEMSDAKSNVLSESEHDFERGFCVLVCRGIRCKAENSQLFEERAHVRNVLFVLVV